MKPVCQRVLKAPTPCKGCGAKGCDFAKPSEPCYGEITGGDEDEEGNWTHCCTGHWANVHGGPYEPFAT